MNPDASGDRLPARRSVAGSTLIARPLVDSLMFLYSFLDKSTCIRCYTHPGQHRAVHNEHRSPAGSVASAAAALGVVCSLFVRP